MTRIARGDFDQVTTADFFSGYIIRVKNCVLPLNRNFSRGRNSTNLESSGICLSES